MSDREQQIAGVGTSGVRGPVVLVTSPHAGSARAGQAAELLERVGITVGARLDVRDLDRTVALGASWREQGYSAAIAAGGDGTVGAVASHLTGSGLPLGILPFGTSNDVARSLGVPLDLDEASEAIAHGAPAQVDIGQASPAVTEPGGLAVHPHEDDDEDGEERDETRPSAQVQAAGAMPTAYFLHALTLGFNVQFARLATDVARRKRWGPLNYATSVLESLTHLKPVEVTLRLSGVKLANGHEQPEAEEQVVTVQALQIAVINTPVFGGRLNLRMPNVRLRDDVLDFVVFEAIDQQALRGTVEGLLSALNNVGGAMREQLGQITQPRADQAAQVSQNRTTDEAAGLALPGVRRFKARSAIMETAEPLDLTLDGEIRARTPARIGVAPNPLHILLPVEAHAALVGEEVLADTHSKRIERQHDHDAMK
ncbi:MAG: diacylglycerol/lipid kinase family protein [Ktedonobacterales bacterium]